MELMRCFVGQCRFRLAFQWVGDNEASGSPLKTEGMRKHHPFMCGLLFVVLSTLLRFRGLTMASKVRVAGQPSGGWTNAKSVSMSSQPD